MKFKDFSKEINEYDLGDGYKLKRENNEDMAKYYAVYNELQNYNSSFRISFDVILHDVKEYNGDAFWITKDEVKIAGVCIEPNRMEGLFLIPPYDNEYEVLKKIKEILVYWSDKTKNIWVLGISPTQVNTYKSLGFVKGRESRWMIRPTEKLDVDFEENFYIDKPREENTLEIAKLITEAENNNPALEEVKVEETADWIKNYYFGQNTYTDCLHKASTAIYDKETKELVGVCLISLWQEWPLIGEISVKPSYQGKGLGSKMIKKSLSALSEKLPVLRLYVVIGNKAENLYYNLGFLKGADIINMKLEMVDS